MISRFVAPQRSNDGQRNGHQGGHDDGRPKQPCRRFDPATNYLRNRFTRLVGIAEIAAHDVAEVCAVLNEHRLVNPKIVTDLG